MCQSRGFRGISHAPHKCSSAWLFHGPPDRHILPACPVRAETGKPAGTDTDFGFAHLLYAGSPYQLTLVVRYRLRGALPRTPAVPKSLPCVHGTQGAYLQKEAVVLLQVKQDHACERLNATCAKVNATASSDSSIYFFNSRPYYIEALYVSNDSAMSYNEYTVFFQIADEILRSRKDKLL